MRVPFFLGREGLLQDVAAGWVGTPFRPRTAVQGPRGGVDCVHLLHAVMSGCGVAHELRPPEYSLDWGHCGDESQLLGYLRGVDCLEEVEELMAGDIVTFRIGNLEHHCGIYLGDDRFIHAVKKWGVVVTDLADKWADRRSVIFRVMEEVES